MLTTPPGRPASCSSSPIRSAVSGVSRGGLITAALPGRKRRCQLAGDHCCGEVPRGHDHDDADRWMVYDDPVGARRSDAERTVDANRLLGVPAEELGGVGDLATGIGERLAVLEGDQPCELVGVLHHQLPRAPQDLAPLARRRRRPRRLRLGGASHAADRVVRCCPPLPRRPPPRSPGSRRRSAPRPAVAPLATDQQLGLHVHIMHGSDARRSTAPDQARRPAISPGARPLVKSGDVVAGVVDRSPNRGVVTTDHRDDLGVDIDHDRLDTGATVGTSPSMACLQ